MYKVCELLAAVAMSERITMYIEAIREGDDWIKIMWINLKITLKGFSICYFDEDQLLSGSLYVIDEFHAKIPSHMWCNDDDDFVFSFQSSSFSSNEKEMN